MIFKNRSDAGKKLAEKLTEYADRKDVVVLGLPRGGVPVAFEVAVKLNARLDVFLVRKLGVPDRKELAFGAIASGGVRVINNAVVKPLNISETEIDKITEKEKFELVRRERKYRNSLSAPNVYGKIVLLVDDGLATGATMRAAAIALQNLKPAKIIVAVPVASPETCDECRKVVDKIICAVTPQPFYGVGRWYINFTQVTDEEVLDLLSKAKANLSAKLANSKTESFLKNLEIRNRNSISN